MADGNTTNLAVACYALRSERSRHSICRAPWQQGSHETKEMYSERHSVLSKLFWSISLQQL